MADTFKVGDAVVLITGAVYLNTGKAVPSKNLNTKLYVKEVVPGGYTISRTKDGSILGDVSSDYIEPYTDKNVITIDPYVIKVLTNNFPVYHSPSKNSGVIRRVNRSLLTIIDEKNGFGKLKVGKGWIELEKVLVL